MEELIEEQHPIPQDISSYQFRLVGDMTLKQFLQVAGGALIGLLFYASPLHPFIKWPLIIFSLIMGIALAFLPLEDRPLATWIFAFFRSIYSPTLYVWRRSPFPEVLFAPEGELPLAAAPTPPTAPPEEKPALELAQMQAVLAAPVVKPEQISEVMSGTIYKSEEESKALTSLEQKEQSFLTKMTRLFTAVPVKKAEKEEEAEVEVPEPITITVSPDEKYQSKAEYKPVDEKRERFEDFTEKVTPTFTQTAVIGGVPVSFSDVPSAPAIPTKPNVVVGQVADDEGGIVDGAILEIKDEDSRPVRALKTNKLGHFMIVTPLLDGKYEITTEKEGFVFDAVTFSAEGKIIPPIIIKAKGKEALTN